MDSYLSARFWSRCGRGGQVVNVRAVYSDDPSLNPTYVEIIEKRQGIKIACLEEIALKEGFISKDQLLNIINNLKDGIDYKNYLMQVYKN